MTSAPTPVRALTALTAAAATTAYYATPDVIRSRTARGWTKAALMVVIAATTTPELRDLRASRAALRAAGDRHLERSADEDLAAPGTEDAVEPEDGTPGGTAPDDDFPDGPDALDADGTASGEDSDGCTDCECGDESSPTWRTGVRAVAAVAMIAGSVAGTVAVERWIFRRGEARAAAGKSLPHTGPAIVLGVLGGLLALIPDPEADDEPFVDEVCDDEDCCSSDD